MGQQLLFAAILAGFSAGVLITWFVSRRQLEIYRKEAAAVLNARDDILEYVNALSLLVPQARGQGLRNTDVLNLREVVDSIKDQLRDLQKRVDRIEVRETAHWRELEQPGELDHTRNGHELALSAHSGAQSKSRKADRQKLGERRRPANANTSDAEPVTGFSQQPLNLVSGGRPSQLIGAFPMEPISVRRVEVESCSAYRSARGSGPTWEPISAKEPSQPQPPYSRGRSDQNASSASGPTRADP